MNECVECQRLYVNGRRPVCRDKEKSLNIIEALAPAGTENSSSNKAEGLDDDSSR